jgi:hypothetical protein
MRNVKFSSNMLHDFAVFFLFFFFGCKGESIIYDKILAQCWNKICIGFIKIHCGQAPPDS